MPMNVQVSITFPRHGWQYLNLAKARSFKQYLAVGPFPSQAHSPDIGSKATRPSHSCIQVWSLAPSQGPRKGKKTGPVKADPGVLKCEIVLCLDAGPAYELKWCPLPSHDLVYDLLPLDLYLVYLSPRSSPQMKIDRESWGCSRGHLKMDPSQYLLSQNRLISLERTTTRQSQSLVRSMVYVPLFIVAKWCPIVKLPDPILRIELEDSCCWSFDWGNSEVVAIGTTTGATILLVYFHFRRTDCL